MMSKFDELRQAYISARKEYFARRDASAVFALSFVEDMERYLECPRLRVRLLSSTGASSSTAARDGKGAVALGSDGQWHFRVGLDLVDDADGFHKDAARQTVVFELLVQPDAGGLNVGLKGWSERFSLPATGAPAERARLYDFWFKRVIDSYLQPGQGFFEHAADSNRTIG
jgi:hypothetical protein